MTLGYFHCDTKGKEASGVHFLHHAVFTQVPLEHPKLLKWVLNSLCQTSRREDITVLSLLAQSPVTVTNRTSSIEGSLFQA